MVFLSLTEVSFVFVYSNLFTITMSPKISDLRKAFSRGSKDSKGSRGSQGSFSKKKDEEPLEQKDAINYTKVKLVLLGASGSGKSTLAKQTKILFQDGYSEDDRKGFKGLIYNNIVQSMLSILDAMPTLEIEFAEQERKADAESVRRDALSINAATNDKEIVLPEALTAALKRLWADAGVQECVGQASKFQLYDSTKYYYQALDRLRDDDYIPTEQDVLRSKVQTCGVIKSAFKYRELDIALFDVGGARCERRKWSHCYDDVTAVAFCVAISAYDQKLDEDKEINRMQESLSLFEEICNAPWSRDAYIILLLNKIDLFRNKLETSPLTACFPDYPHENVYSDATAYIQKQFENRNHQPEKKIHTYLTNFTDSDNVQFIIHFVSSVLGEEKESK